jgi:hypothetical protein
VRSAVQAVTAAAGLTRPAARAAPEPEAESEESRFSGRMARYLGRGRRGRTATPSLHMADYRLTNDLERGEHDPGIGAEPPHPGLGIKIARPAWLHKGLARTSTPWRHPAAKGGPCSAAGACDHGRREARDHEYFRRGFQERYKDWTTDGSGGPARHRPPYHAIERYVATDEASGEGVVPALDFDAAAFPQVIPRMPSRNFVASVEGNLLVTASDVYTFCTSSSDRSVLFVDNHEVVANDGLPERGALHPAQERCGKVGLFKGLHPVRAVEFQANKPISFAATYSGADTAGKKVPVPSSGGGWILKVEPSLPALWDPWYATYVPRLAPVADDDLMANPLGETRVTSPALKGEEFVKPGIADLPAKDYFVTLIGEFAVRKGGAYEFCAPGKDGSFLFIDDRKALHCVHPTSDAAERCARLHLLAGKHTVKAAVRWDEPIPDGTLFTYSGVDTAYERESFQSPSGWVLRAYGAPAVAWNRWYGDVCRRPQESVSVGDEELMEGLDDFVPPNDAYVHDQLTSGSYGYDHFGNLEPLSKENQDLMYGEDFGEGLHRIIGRNLHSPGRGGRGHHSDTRSRLGDEQIDDDDREVPVMVANPAYPGADPDHFDHWRWNSSLNQELLNGRNWQYLKRDGLMDRHTPVDEAYKQPSGGSHDRHPVADLFVNTWNIGHEYGPAKWTTPSSIYAMADRRLLSDRIGETSGPSPNLCDATPIHKVPGLPKEGFVQVASGRLVIRATGTYTFCSTPTDPSITFVDGSKVVVNDGAREECGTVGLSAGPHAVRVVSFQGTPSGCFNATYSGPDTASSAPAATAAPNGAATAADGVAIPAAPAWTLRAYRATPEEWDEWVAVRRMPAARAARLWSDRHPEPWVKGRLDTQGKAWREHVFTGTHERIEDHRGIAQNTYHDDGAYI